MKFTIGILISFASFFMLFLFLAIFSSSSFVVSRQEVFKKSKQEVWHKFSRFKKWESWSQWHRQDNSISYIYYGKQGRKGAGVSWEGKQIGKGSMVVTEIIPFNELSYAIQLSAWDSETEGKITLSETEEGTLVEWKTTGNLSFWMRPFGSLGFFDTRIGKDFELSFQAIRNQLNQD